MSLWSAMLKPAAHGRFGARRGETVTQIHSNGDGSATVSIHQEVDHLLKANRELQRADDYTGDFQGGWGRRVARIPLTVINKWLFEEGFDAMRPENLPEVLQRLDDPDYSDLKVVDQKVSRYGRKRAYMRASTSAPRIIMPGKEGVSDAGS